MISELPRFDIVGPYRHREAEALYALDYIDRVRTVDHYDTEIPLTPERAAQLGSIISATEHFLLDLDVRLPQERIPETKRFHYFSTAQDMRSAAGYNEQDPRYGKAHGICDYHNVLITEAGDDSTLLTSQHESIHFMAHQAWRPTPMKIRRFGGLLRNTIYIPTPVRSGYIRAVSELGDPPRFDMMQEMFIEMISIYIKQNYWQSYDDLPMSNVFVPGYFRLLVTGEEMISKAARSLGMSQKEIFLPIAKGLFSGEMDGLRLLSQGLGTAAFRAAVHAGPLDISPNLAIRMGVPEANERISRATPRHPVEIFGWM